MRMEPKSFASLSSGLLARKGQARPAMRPQAIRNDTPRLDDLGWDDMGMDIAPPMPALAAEPDAVAEPAPLLAPKPAARVEAAPVIPTPVAEVIQQIETAFTDNAAVSRLRAEPGSKGKSAFTLRLDPERHLKLRLACALRHRSAQRVVTDALDVYLASIPGLDDAMRFDQSAPAK